MKLGEIVTHLEVEPRKLTRYALDPASPKGGPKAALFQRLLGFTQENAGGLIEQLLAHALEAEARFHSEDQYGRRYTVDLPVEGTEGRRATVRTAWLVPPGGSTGHLVTLYVKKR